MRHITYNLEELPQAVAWVWELGKNVSIWRLEGDMGAGKTTFAKALCHYLKVEDTVQSPTFSIVNEYKTSEGKQIYHFDCYRLKNFSEALDFGIEEYLDSGNLCLIEWASNIEVLLPADIFTVVISPMTHSQRKLTIALPNIRWHK